MTPQLTKPLEQSSFIIKLAALTIAHKHAKYATMCHSAQWQCSNLAVCVHVAECCCSQPPMICTVRRPDPSVPVYYLACSFPLAFCFFRFLFSDPCFTFNGNIPTQVSVVLLDFTYFDSAKTAKNWKMGPVDSSLQLWLAQLISVTFHIYAVGSMHSWESFGKQRDQISPS